MSGYKFTHINPFFNNKLYDDAIRGTLEGFTPQELNDMIQNIDLKDLESYKRINNSILLAHLEEFNQLSGVEQLLLVYCDIFYRQSHKTRIKIHLSQEEGSGKSHLAANIWENIHKKFKLKMVLKNYFTANIYELREKLAKMHRYETLVYDEDDRQSYGDAGSFQEAWNNEQARCRRRQVNFISCRGVIEDADEIPKGYTFVFVPQNIFYPFFIECNIFKRTSKKTELGSEDLLIGTVMFPFPSEKVHDQYELFKDDIIEDTKHLAQKGLDYVSKLIKKSSEALLKDKIYLKKKGANAQRYHIEKEYGNKLLTKEKSEAVRQETNGIIENIILNTCDKLAEDKYYNSLHKKQDKKQYIARKFKTNEHKTIIIINIERIISRTRREQKELIQSSLNDL